MFAAGQEPAESLLSLSASLLNLENQRSTNYPDRLNELIPDEVCTRIFAADNKRFPEQM